MDGQTVKGGTSTDGLTDEGGVDMHGDGREQAKEDETTTDEGTDDRDREIELGDVVRTDTAGKADEGVADKVAKETGAEGTTYGEMGRDIVDTDKRGSPDRLDGCKVLGDKTESKANDEGKQGNDAPRERPYVGVLFTV